MKIFICGLLAVIWSLPLSAEIYKIRDEQGRVTYTDAPPPKDQPHETVELGPINIQPPVEPQFEFRPAPEEQDAVDYTISLVAPTDGTHVPPGQRNLRVTAQVEPELRPEHRIAFIMNGKPQASPSRNSGLVITEIYRGAHTLSAQVVDEQGRILATSPTITVYVHRPTIHSPAR